MGVIDAIRRIGITGAHIATKPSEWARVPKWLGERRAAPLSLRVPWWPYAMVEYIDQALPRPSRVFEYGGGGSSLWLTDREADLTVVEHHAGWVKQLRAALPDTVDILAVTKTADGDNKIRSSIERGFFDSYVGAVDQFSDGEFDLVIVDGRARVDCALHAMPKVKPGGLLLLDDSDRPRYRAVHVALAGWGKTSIRGLKPGENIPSTTTAWLKPE